MLTRGSKTAAEKVVRESESGPDMGSPDRRESIPPVTDIQDSPLFKFLCELSPIQPAKSVHHAQTYNELTFPQEHRVFASPRSATRRSSTSSLKRCVAAERVPAQVQAESRERIGWQDGGTMSRSTVCGSPSPLNRRSGDRQVTPCSRRQAEEAGASQCEDVMMEAASGDDVVVGEERGAANCTEPNPECSSQEAGGTGGECGGGLEVEYVDCSPLESGVSAAMASEMVRCSDGKGGRVGGARGEVSDARERRQSTSSVMSHVIDCVVAGDRSETARCLEGEELRRLLMGCSSGVEGHELRFSPVARGSPELDRETTAMAYFLAGNEDGGPGKEEWSEDSSEVVVPRVEGVGAAVVKCGREGSGKDSGAGRSEGEMVDAITPQSGVGTRSEGEHEAATVMTAEGVGQQQGLLSSRGESSGGQRGIRRRCLDFDASGGRRKSLGSIGGRKGVGSRLKDCSGSIGGDGGNGGGVVGGVVRGTVDGSSGRVGARLKDVANAMDFSRDVSDSGAHTRGASTCGDGLGATARMQFGSGSFQKGLDDRIGKGGEAQTPSPQNCGALVPVGGLRRSPRVRATGIGLHLNSLTTAVPLKREHPGSGGESSKGVLATVLGLQGVVCANPKGNACGEGLGSAGYGGVVSGSLNGQVGRVLEMSGADVASAMKSSVSIPAPDFRCLDLESLSALEESLALTPGASVLGTVSPRGQKRSQGGREELMRVAQADGEGEAMEEILESPQSSKRRRLSRRKSTVASQSEKSGEGCKHCKCKKSKCLKLYCECFHAGVYCVGSCICRDCLNKPEYEETVSNTRAQIESRDPSAFAPKIVHAAESSPVPGDEAFDTPASARHKRGCKCKKSLCLKKYCECYQAGVGCSEGCRCEGCKNVYGRKEGTQGDKEGEQAKTGRLESQVSDPMAVLNRLPGKCGGVRDSAKANLSPITPSFEHDGVGRPMVRLRSTGRKRGSTTEERCASPLPDGALGRPASPSRLSQSVDGFHLVPYPAQVDTEFSMGAAGESPMTTPTFARVEHASPRWESLDELCTLTPLAVGQVRPTPGSSCLTIERRGSSPAFCSQMTESSYHAGSTSVHRRAGSRHWSPHKISPGRFRQPARRSPLRFDTPHQSELSDPFESTPVTPSIAQLASSQEEAVLGTNREGELESAKAAVDDDGTPEFFEYGEESMGSPRRSTVTKSLSPKQKRVTPPRYGGNRQGGVGGGSGCGGVPLARKFILQALPPAPSVAPSYPNG